MGSYNISVNQGETFSLTALLKESDGNCINLSGYSVRGQVRYSYGSTGVLLDLQPTIHHPESGAIKIFVSAKDMESLPITVGVYDIERYSGEAYVYRVLNGKFTINPEVTK